MNLLAPRSILIVDDEPDVRESLSEAIELSGYDPTAVSNGLDALQVLAGSRKPGLVLLDLMMPAMDGFEFMRVKEDRAELADIPVVVISADGFLEVKVKGYRVAGWLKKPISLDKLLETIEKHFKQI